MTTEAKFKAGDKVRCIEGGLYSRAGKIYEIDSVTTYGELRILGIPGDCLASRFEMLPATVTSAPVEGEILWNGAPCGCVGGHPCPKCGVCARCFCDAKNGLTTYCDERAAKWKHRSPQPAPKPANPTNPDPYATERTGPYGGSDLGHEQVVAALTLRDAKVKVLRAEMGREPMKPRFPSPGRFDGLPCHEWPNGDEKTEP